MSQQTCQSKEYIHIRLLHLYHCLMKHYNEDLVMIYDEQDMTDFDFVIVIFPDPVSYIFGTIEGTS